METLYHQTGTGKLRIWKTQVRDCDVIVETGDCGGKQILYKTTYPTNERAQIEATRKWAKKKDHEGYTENESGISSEVFLPMTAQEYDNVSDRQFPAFVQPKLDGVRCIARGNPPNLISRRNTNFLGFTKIERELIDLLARSTDELYLDGELYSHKLTFQEISGIVRDQCNWNRKELLYYYIYDCYFPGNANLPFKERYQTLRRLFQPARFECLVLLPTISADNDFQVHEHKRIWTKDGFEGAIWRASLGQYRPNYRSPDLLKLKDFQDEEYPIVGWKEGQGTDKGTVIWICCDDQSKKEFAVRPEGTRIQRQALLQTAEQYLGKLLTVKHQGKTNDGLPRFPIGKTIRDYE